MRAAVMHETGGPEVLRIEDVPVPKITSTQVLVQVAACGLCGHDQADRVGLTPVHLPAVLGHEISGIVEAVGSGVRGFAVGDRVASKQFTTCGHCEACWSGEELHCAERAFNYGGYAEYVALEDTAIIRVPDHVDLVGASVVACTVGTTLQALDRIAGLRPGEHVVVSGAGGGLGLHGLQVAKAMGGHTVALTSSPSKVEELEKYGADDVVVTGDGNEAKRLLEATGGKGVDVVLDNVGHPAVFNPGFRALAERGRYVFTGQVARTKIELYPAFVFAKEAVITGSASTLMSTFHRSMQLVAEGRVQPVVHTYQLEDAADAHRAIDDKAVLGRAVVVP